MTLLNQPFDDAQLGSGEDLDLRNIGPKAWPKLLEECRSENVRLYHVTLQSLDGIEQLRSVKNLTIEWASKIVDPQPLFKLRNLERLSIFDAPKIREIDGIEKLTNLVELNLSGNRGSLTPKMKLASLEPVTRLPNLSHFSLANARLEDDDIAVLSKCSALQELSLSNQFDRTEFALLAKALNGQLVRPIAASTQVSMKCEHCQEKMHLIRGRRMPFLCRSCDEAKFEKYLSRFEKLMHDA